MLFQIRFRGERRPVHARQRVVVLVTRASRPPRPQEGRRPDLARRLDVGALTEVLPVVLHVEGDLLVVGFLVEYLQFVLVVGVDLFGLLTGPDLALNVVVGRDDLVHLLLDGVEVVLVEVDVGHVVVEPLVGRGPIVSVASGWSRWRACANTWAAGGATP